MALVVGVDSSTASVTVEVRDVETGRVWAVGRRPHPVALAPRAEHDPLGWWSALVQALHDAGRYHDVAAIAVAGQQHAMVCLDDDGEVIRAAKLGVDTESASQAAELVERLGAAGWAKACGTVPTAALTITKLAWLRDHEPDQYARISSVMLPHDWLTYRLTGRQVTDRGDASGTGYWSPAEGRWRTDLLRLVDPDADWASRLPLVLSPFEAAGYLQPSAARPLGLEGLEVVVAPGTGDTMAAALGLGMVPGDVAVSIGRTGFVAAVSASAVADPTGEVAGFADATGNFLPVVGCGPALDVGEGVARVLGVEPGPAFDGLVLGAAPGSGGLTLVPSVGVGRAADGAADRAVGRTDGATGPGRATGAVLGFSADTTAAQMARAAVEGVVCALLEGLDALRTAGVATEGRLFLIGAGARSAAHRRVLADLAQREVLVPEAIEHAATGACLQAAAVLTRTAVEDLAAEWDLGTGEVVEPDTAVDARRVRQAFRLARESLVR